MLGKWIRSPVWKNHMFHRGEDFCKERYRDRLCFSWYVALISTADTPHFIPKMPHISPYLLCGSKLTDNGCWEFHVALSSPIAVGVHFEAHERMLTIFICSFSFVINSAICLAEHTGHLTFVIPTHDTVRREASLFCGICGFHRETWAESVIIILLECFGCTPSSSRILPKENLPQEHFWGKTFDTLINMSLQIFLVFAATFGGSRFSVEWSKLSNVFSFFSFYCVPHQHECGDICSCKRSN